ncbi:VOC family protein [Actinacidiphila bryophytorum]|uniref:Anthracycline biosynthesis protein DauV n=1 Tax=Actinacidiphila bryophytorum TaxID=1436133 RepID=A0A9W4H2H5_9ACTN|nr:VOC family protein [Actinacidiphila bryophytorum]MBM9440318.1 VOC family protein [Actinacidiphila bryophytorum]MBN6546746.1 VOC family protein [Actinacidiphila bryophytorum]CAG7645611.1 putative Anthracycline biosynthesis protein DauV [Actinacidiphila bryophytorum]
MTGRRQPVEGGPHATRAADGTGTPREGGTSGAETTGSQVACGAPCWVSLTARDLAAAEKFYGTVLDWEFRSTTLGERFAVAVTGGRPLATIGAVAGDMQVAVGWTPFFAVSQADEATARIRERSATVALGPVSFASGRAVLAADRDGAVFGVWDGRLPGGWQSWHDRGPVVVRLRTRDAFESAIFYGGVLEWADEGRGCCSVSYEYEKAEVVVRSCGEVVARISSGAVEAAPDPAVRPHWAVHFAVEDVAACMEAARALGGAVLGSGGGPAGPWADLRDPDGALFTVFSR